MQVTFLRHGQSEHNAGLTSFLDSKLTKLGESQAIATADRLYQEGVNSTNATAFVSPFQRTLQTFEPTKLRTGIEAEVFTSVCEYFSVRNEGYLCFEGLSATEIARRFPWANQGGRFDVEEIWWPKELESVDVLYQRAVKVRDTLIEHFLKTDLQIFVTSHADPIGRMIEAFLRVEPAEDRPPWSENCGITRLEVTSNDQPARIILLNDASHLDPGGLHSPA